jgi:hypothetical protein
MKYDPNEFSAYDPYATFSSLENRRFIKSTGESSFSGWSEPLDDDEQALWRLGKNAFDALNATSRDDFEHAYQTYIDGMQMNREILAELSENDTILIQNSNEERISPDWSKYPPDEILAFIWQIFSQIPREKHPQEFQALLRQSFLFACFKLIEHALIAHMLDGRGLLSAVLGAASAFANAEVLTSDNPTLTKARQELAYKGAMERIRRDPKTADKMTVRDYWVRWTKQPDLYKNKAEFVRDMLDGKTTALKGNSETVNRWIREWERSEDIKYPYLVKTT